MNNIELKVGVCVLTIALITTLFIEKYKYDDCKKVGHATMYCVFNMFK